MPSQRQVGIIVLSEHNNSLLICFHTLSIKIMERWEVVEIEIRVNKIHGGHGTRGDKIGGVPIEQYVLTETSGVPVCKKGFKVRDSRTLLRPRR